MKIGLKLSLCFGVCALLVAVLSTVISNQIFFREMFDDRTNEYDLTIHQTLNSMQLIAKDIESNFLSLYTGTDLTKSVNETNVPQATRTRNIVSKLRYMCYDSVYFTAMAFVSLDDQIYSGAVSPNETSDVMERVILECQPYLRDQYTQWFIDSQGNVYIKKDLYDVTPLYYCGMIIARLDTDYLRSLLGMNTIALRTGEIAISTAQGNPILSNGMLTFGEISRIQREYLSKGYSYSGMIEYNNTTYCLQADELDHGWKMMHMVSLEDMQTLPNRVSRSNFAVMVLVFISLLPILWLFSFSLTRGIKHLYNAMNEVSGGNWDIRLTPVSHDEVGELTRHFAWLIGQLQESTQAMIAQATEKKQAEYAMLETKYRSLQAQISPHFICNILTTINAQASMGHSDKVSDLAILSSRYLRDNLRNSDQKKTSLSREIQYVKDYLDIYRCVYGDHVRLIVQAPQEVMEMAVPTMVLQPLCENTLVHCGLDVSVQVCKISIDATVAEDRLIITVCDNGKGFKAETLEVLAQNLSFDEISSKLKGFGLRGVIQRLKYLYGDHHEFSVSSTDEGTRIKISIPIEKESDLRRLPA